jgi:hypothetical protein
MTTKKKSEDAMKKKSEDAIVIPPVTRDPTNKDPIEYWADWVGASWRESVKGIIETGKRLKAFKGECNSRGLEWLKETKERLGFGQNMAYKLLSIAEKEKVFLLHVVNLPSCWGTLAQLATFDEGTLVEKIASGEVNVNTERKDVDRMKRDPKPKVKPDVISRSNKAQDNMMTEYQKRAREGKLTDLEHGEVVEETKKMIDKLSGFISNVNELNPPNKRPVAPVDQRPFRKPGSKSINKDRWRDRSFTDREFTLVTDAMGPGAGIEQFLEELDKFDKGKQSLSDDAINCMIGDLLAAVDMCRRAVDILRPMQLIRGETHLKVVK